MASKCTWQRKEKAQRCCSSMASPSSGTPGATKFWLSAPLATEPLVPISVATATRKPQLQSATTPAFIDSLGVNQVFLVAQDWGAMIGWYLCTFRPDRVKAYVCLIVPLMPRNPRVKPLDGFRAVYGEDYYICRFQEPGKAEAEMARIGCQRVLKHILTTRNVGAPIIPK